MLSKSFTFFLGILTVLLATAVYFPGTATAQSEEPQLIRLPSEEFLPEGFIVYGKAPTQEKAGIIDTVRYRQTIDPLPDLELFFEFGGTLELLTTNFSLSKHDVVISEILWGTDGNYPTDGDDTYTQWIELYNTYPGGQFTPPLFLLFTLFANYPDRQIVELPNGQRALVLDAVSNLHLGRWDLPGRSGRRPYSNVVSAYRDITYPNSPNSYLRRAKVLLGSYSWSWKATPERGRRNTLLSIVDDRDRVVELPYIATPGREHVPDAFLQAPSTIPVRSNQVIINEVRNDVSEDNLDWIELKNVSRSGVQLEDWELSIVTGVGGDIDLVDLPYYEMSAGEILLLQPRHPKSTVFAGGINIEDPEARARGATHKYFVVPGLNLPNAGKFVLLLRSESDKNGQDAAIADYAGNGFFADPSIAFNTEFWPRQGQPRPTDVADFGFYGSFGSLDSAWARKPPYNRDTGHHKDAWERVGTQGGVGYAPGADRAISPGTPGYENKALKTRIDDGNFSTTAIDNQYNSGEVTISEVMSDGGPRRNKAQWIELYNSSLTQAINLEGWELEVRNLEDDVVPYVNGSFIFNAAIILPNQTLLLVSKRGPNNVAENRVYDLRDQHRSELGLSNRWSSLLNPDGFYLKLTDKGDPRLNADDIVVDEVGNLNIEKNGTPTKVWDLPERDPEVRLSLVRQYGASFRPNQRESDRTPDPAAVGTWQEAWHQADRDYIGVMYYGDDDDRGTPSHRLGSPLPVVLSSFQAERTATRAVVIRWTTESELNNAGFNILRGATRNGEFERINNGLIQGAGTTGERQTYQWTDTTPKLNVAYYYRIEDISFSGHRQQLGTVRMKGHVSRTGKLTTTWGNLKLRN